VRNLRRGDRIALDAPEEPLVEVVSVDTADAPGYYGVRMRIIGGVECRPMVNAVWPGDDLVELA
jgi:hypothetical protein